MTVASATAASRPTQANRPLSTIRPPVVIDVENGQKPRWSEAAGSRILLVGAILVSQMVGGCVPPTEPTAIPMRTPLPTRQVVTAPIPTVTIVPSATNTAVPPRTFTLANFDPYVSLYVAEREGNYVTSRIDRARYYYRWDDRRWFAISERVWFRNAEDLRTVFPDRVPAP